MALPHRPRALGSGLVVTTAGEPKAQPRALETRCSAQLAVGRAAPELGSLALLRCAVALDWWETRTRRVAEGRPQLGVAACPPLKGPSWETTGADRAPMQLGAF